jgi:protein-S-isoprenylcysteine O-methyltransferase Ste14
LVTWGPYRYVRHPIYLSYVLSSAGLLMVFFSWGFLVLMGLHLLRLFRRIPDEETTLARRYGPAYEAYLNTSGRILPRFSAIF